MTPPASRLAWIDHLRAAMIALVVNMHACVTYSHVGDWYVKEPPEPGMAVKVPFLFWQGHLQAFFMGVLFFVAGSFAYRSLARRGPLPFAGERLLRLGVPSLLYMLAIHPFMVFILLGRPSGDGSPELGERYLRYLASGRFLNGSGPLWFAVALLLFCVALAAWAAVRGSPRPGIQRPGPVSPPSGRHLVGFAFGLVALTFVVRLVFPVGTSVSNLQLCYFPQYLLAFAVGVRAGQHGWLEPLLQSRPVRIAGWLGLLGGPVALATLAGLGGPPPETGPNPYTGGWNVRALAFAAWEQLAGLGLGLGVMAWFRSRWNQENRLARWLGDRSFGVYVLHAPVLVALTLGLRPLTRNEGPLLNVAVLTVLGLVASYAVAALAHRVPGLRRFLA